MRILHILDHSVPYIDGYSVRSRFIIKGQKEIGLKPVVLTSPLHRDTWSSSPEIIDDIPYYRIRNDGISSRPFLREIQIVKKIKAAIFEICQNHRLDLIHAHSPSLNGFAARVIHKKTGIPWIYEVRAIWEDAAVDQGKFTDSSLKYKIGRYIETSVLKRSHAITVIADSLKKDLVSRNIRHEKIFHVPNGVDTSYFSPRERNHQILHDLGITADNKMILGFIGSFFRFEGIDVLLDVMKITKTERMKIHLLLVGKGRDEKHIQNRIKTENIENVTVVGHIPFEKVRDYYAISDVLVYPRLSSRLTENTTPLKPLEAMAMGKVVLGSNVGGLREIIKDGQTGVLFKPSNLFDLKDKLEFLTQDSRFIELGKNAREFVVKYKDWKIIVNAYKKINDEVINNYSDDCKD